MLLSNPFYKIKHMAIKQNYDCESLLNIKFNKNVKGYDAYEVDVTLDKIIQDYNVFAKYYADVSSYVQKLEFDIHTYREKIKEQEIEVAKLTKRLEGFSGVESGGNIEDKKRIARLEVALYKLGVDPKKIK